MKKDRALGYVAAGGFMLAVLVESLQEKDLSSSLLAAFSLIALAYLLLAGERNT